MHALSAEAETLAYVLNRVSRIPVAQPEECEYRIPVYDMEMYIFKVGIVTKQAKYE